MKEVLVGTRRGEVKRRKSSTTPQKGEEEQDEEEVLGLKKKRLRTPKKSCRKGLRGRREIESTWPLPHNPKSFKDNIFQTPPKSKSPTFSQTIQNLFS